MALGANTQWEIRTTGSDTANSGAFDSGQSAAGFTDGAATSATTSAPVFTSVSYTFVAGDVGAYVFLSGTNWFTGWYNITSVSAGAATLNANIGQVVSGTTNQYAINTAVGAASVSSPTAATWIIDYSQQDAPKYTYTDLASAGAGLTVSSALQPFAKEQVGNSLLITGGTNFTVGRYVIASVAAGVATVVGPGNITTGAGALGTGALGGALASPGQAASAAVTGNDFYIKSGTYSITSASTNISGGCITSPAGASGSNLTKWIGYNSVRGDFGTRPLLQASGIATFTILSVATINSIRNINFDGAGLTSSKGIGGSVVSSVYYCKFSNFTNGAIASNTSMSVLSCEATGCSTVAAFSGARYFGCVAHDNTFTGFSTTDCNIINCIACNNTGASSDGFLIAPASASPLIINCLAYANGRQGFSFTFGTTLAPLITNCIAVNNGAFGFTASAFCENYPLFNCAGYNNTSGLVNSSNIPAGVQYGTITLTGDPFVNAAGNNFALNNTAGAGAALRALGLPASFPGLSTSDYLDVGPAQHQDSGGSSTFIYNLME